MLICIFCHCLGRFQLNTLRKSNIYTTTVHSRASSRVKLGLLFCSRKRCHLKRWATSCKWHNTQFIFSWQIVFVKSLTSHFNFGNGTWWHLAAWLSITTKCSIHNWSVFYRKIILFWCNSNLAVSYKAWFSQYLCNIMDCFGTCFLK